MHEGLQFEFVRDVFADLSDLRYARLPREDNAPCAEFVIDARAFVVHAVGLRAHVHLHAGAGALYGADRAKVAYDHRVDADRFQLCGVVCNL